MMSGTFGRTGTGSSNTTVLTSLLGSKLRAKTALGGSILYRTTWQELTTPAGRSLSVLRASAWTGGAAPKRGGWNGPYAFVPDRKGGGAGKRVLVRVDCGGRRVIKKKKRINK